MTNEELRELDAWIAEHVMGWDAEDVYRLPIPRMTRQEWEMQEDKTLPWYYEEGGDEFVQSVEGEWLLPPRYSTDIAAAWDVVEKIGLPWMLEGTRAYFGEVMADGDTITEAICIAAKKWKELQ